MREDSDFNKKANGEWKYYGWFVVATSFLLTFQYSSIPFTWYVYSQHTFFFCILSVYESGKMLIQKTNSSITLNIISKNVIGVIINSLNFQMYNKIEH